MNEELNHAMLCERDSAALDALMDAGMSVEGVGPEHAERAERIADLLSTLDRMPDHRPGDLLKPRTMRAIERVRGKRAAAEVAMTTGGFRIPMRDMVAAAVLVLVSGIVLWPMIAHGRTTARQLACQANLGQAGQGMSVYALTSNDLMPATHLRLGDPWNQTGHFDEQGNAQSNSAHLFQLVKQGYLSGRELRCPSNVYAPGAVDPAWRDWPVAEMSSFSYQNQYARQLQQLHADPERAVLADRSPFFGRDGSFRFVDQDGDGRHDIDARSFNHGGDGQNVLRADGHAAWESDSYLPNGDGIYHSGDEGLDYYTGVEGPAGDRDSFLVP